ncbi:hypothetical protein [Haloferax sp. YSMS24]|uniref:hypothetical protein n=1 Tax=Haloferax sp. YSMS24 TaxID=3388425 RepID=UPI00398CD052
MNRQRILAVTLALAGAAAVAVGIYQELLHVAPGYEGMIETGWSGRINHGERLLAQLGAVGVGGTLAALRWKYAAVVPLGVGVVELGYPIQAVLHYARDPGLYTQVQKYDGSTTELVLGAEPFLLAAGGLCFLGAAVFAWRLSHQSQTAGDVRSQSVSHP